jgi:hypothetical protein
MLLEVDGLDKAWNGIPTDDAYDGAFGEIDIDDVPNALRRIHNPANNRNYDTSSAAEGNVESNVNNNEEETESMDDSANKDDDETSKDDDVVVNDDEYNNEDGIVDDEDLKNKDIRTDDKGVRVVRLLSQKFFRDRLVEHFDIMYQRDKIQWPKRRGAKPAVFFDQ